VGVRPGGGVITPLWSTGRKHVRREIDPAHGESEAPTVATASF
jgi:hypothetical protein